MDLLINLIFVNQVVCVLFTLLIGGMFILAFLYDEFIRPAIMNRRKKGDKDGVE